MDGTVDYRGQSFDLSLPLGHDPPALGLDVPPGRQVERHRHPHLGLFQLPQARHIDAAMRPTPPSILWKRTPS